MNTPYEQYKLKHLDEEPLAALIKEVIEELTNPSRRSPIEGANLFNSLNILIESTNLLTDMIYKKGLDYSIVYKSVRSKLHILDQYESGESNLILNRERLSPILNRYNSFSEVYYLEYAYEKEHTFLILGFLSYTQKSKLDDSEGVVRLILNKYLFTAPHTTAVSNYGSVHSGTIRFMDNDTERSDIECSVTEIKKENFLEYKLDAIEERK